MLVCISENWEAFNIIGEKRLNINLLINLCYLNKEKEIFNQMWLNTKDNKLYSIKHKKRYQL